MRWFWIDKFLEFRSGEYAMAVKNISLAEDYLRDHFPGYPVMPSSLIIEGMAQTAGILASQAKNFEKMVVLAKISRAEFFDKAVPGDQLTYEAKLIDVRDEGASVECKAHVNGRPLAEAEIVFGHLDRPGVTPESQEAMASYRRAWFDVLGVPT